MMRKVAHANRNVGLLSWSGITDEPYSGARFRWARGRTVS
jgi:hypothetical protein